jgi:carbamoyl-phosphate synthase small subunit
MVGANLVEQVISADRTTWNEPLCHLDNRERRTAPPRAHVVAIDCGIKHNILRHLADVGCRVTVVPASANEVDIRALAPDGLLVGNGPGDPAAVTDLIQTLRTLLGRYPVFGICLGHQLLALALGARTYKLPFGHHGANLPVLDRRTQRVEITSQNHGFAVDAASLAQVGATVTHMNLNDHTVEGFAHPDLQLEAVQFHPEASPGPHDATHLFGTFVQCVSGRSLALPPAPDRPGRPAPRPQSSPGAP